MTRFNPQTIAAVSPRHRPVLREMRVSTRLLRLPEKWSGGSQARRSKAEVEGEMKFMTLLANMVLSLGILTSTSAGATTVIDNSPRTPDSMTPSGGIAAVGELSQFEGGIAGFYGESFIAPVADHYATDLQFSMETFFRDLPRQQGPVKFRVLLVATGSASAPFIVSLADVLFASPDMFLPQGSFWTNIDVSLGNTQLIGGQTYLWVIDGYTPRNGLTGEANVGTKNNWDGGAFYNGGYLDLPGVPLSDINLSQFGGGVDLAFTMTFAAVPEPSTWAMTLLGFAGLGFKGYRLAGTGAPQNARLAR